MGLALFDGGNMACFLSLWLMAATWINAVVGLGFRPMGGGGVVSFMWVCSVGLCWFVLDFWNGF